MALSQINNNISAINATRNLNKTGLDLEKSLERLSSGLRINRASDDASGLSISEKLRTQIRGLNQAIKNAQDGVSLVNTAEGALDETTSILQRIRELSVKAANTGGLDQNAIQAAQDEIDSAIQEITRIGNNTQFSTRRLLNGGNAITATAEAGFGVSVAQGPATTTLADGTHYLTVTQTAAGSSTIASGGDGNSTGSATSTASTFDTGDYAISVSNATATVYNTFETEAWTVLAGGAAASGGDLVTTLDNFGGGAIASGDNIAFSGASSLGYNLITTSYAVTATSTLEDVRAALQASINGADAGTGDDVTVTIDTSGTFTITDNSVTSGSTFALALGVDNGGDSSVENYATVTQTATASQGGAVVSVGGGPAQLVSHGATATFYGPTPTNELDPTPQVTIAFGTLANGNDTLQVVQQAWTGSLDGGRSVSFQNGDQEVLFKNGSNAGFASGESALMNFGSTLTAGTVIVDVVNNGLNFHIGANENQRITVGIGDLRASNLGRLDQVNETVADIDVKSAAGANTAIQIIDAAIEQVSRQRSYLGAISNRLDKTISNLGVSSENLTASESRIRDADIAFETTRFTRNQILLQAGTSILAQANSAPQSVLTLLR